MNLALGDIFVFLVAACAVVPLASRFRLGAVLGYLLAGMLVGPWGLGFITEPESIMHFAEFGVVMMLFVIGLELEPAALWRMRRAIVGMGGLQVALSSVALSLGAMACGLSWQTALAVGMALSLSSTALVLQMLDERNLMHTPVGETSFSILLFQDIAVIPILVLMPLLATQAMPTDAAHASMVAHLPGWAQALCVAGVIGLVVLGGRYLSHHLFRAVAKTNLREIFTALSLALVVGTTLLMQMVGVSPALGAFVAGVVLANSEYRRTLETDIEPFKGLLLGLFFISVGMGIDFGLLAAQPLAIVAVVAALMAIKAAILWLVGRMSGLSPLHNAGFALALSQGGEFAFVLFQFAGGLAILSEEQRAFLTLVVALSIAATPLLMLWYNRVVVPRFMSALPVREFDTVEAQHPVILAGFGRFGQVVGRFLMAKGVPVTVLEKDPDQIDLLRKFGFKGYFGDATRLDLLRGAGAAKAQLLVVAVDAVADSLAIVQLAREEFPHLPIFARARNRQHAYELHQLGVAFFKRELFDSSLDMARAVMLHLGRPQAEVARKAEQFLQHDEATLRDSFEFFGDEPALIDFARTRRAELERILQNDAAQDEETPAAAQ
jgi:monovalent cation:proton antiporter-2 (CPA2) family protein